MRASDARASVEHVVLVPGFFGFTQLGELPYFAHVAPALARAFSARQRPAEVSVVSTDPTASLPYRAARIAEHLQGLRDAGAERFHLVGHSTGGLDARLLVTPAVSLPTSVDVEANARHVRSVVCLSTPHLGTPLASFFAGKLGEGLLQLFSLASIAILRQGRVPIVTLLRLAQMLDRLRSGGRPNPSAMARLHDELLADFTPARQAQLEAFLTQVHADQGLVPQLTPDGLEVFNASTPDRPGVRYGCVITWGRTPSLGSAFAAGFNPYGQATHALYCALHRMSGRMPARRAQGQSPGLDALLEAAFGTVPGWPVSDGIVPVRSQPWGEPVHAAVADHLDVVGYFDDPHGDPPHYDWLTSGSGFDRARFEALWSDVAKFLLDAPEALPAPAPATASARTPGPEARPLAFVSRAAHRGWLLGRGLVWLLAAALGAVMQARFEAGLSSILVALLVAGLGDAIYRRAATVPTARGRAQNLTALPPRYLIGATHEVVSVGRG